MDSKKARKEGTIRINPGPLTYLSYLFHRESPLGLGCGSAAGQAARGGPYAARTVAIPEAFTPIGVADFSAGRLCVWHRSSHAGGGSPRASGPV